MSESGATSTGAETPAPKNGRTSSKSRRRKLPDFGETGLAAFIIDGVIGVIGIGLYASQAPGHLTVFASGLILAVAAGASGGLLGFLFGVPRTVTSETVPPAVGGGAATSVLASMIRPSTNLEQISDWLTKVLVGATLVQLGTIGSGAARLFKAVAPALGGQPSSATFAGAVLIYFSVVGFLAAWLRTRLLLGGLMTKADQALAYLDAATAAEVDGKRDAAIALYRSGAILAHAARNLDLAHSLQLRATELMPSKPPPGQ